MKFSVCFLFIFLISTAHTSSLYETINMHKSYIFKTLRNMKQGMPPKVIKILDKTIRDLETKYIISKQGFMDMLFNLYEEHKNFDKDMGIKVLRMESTNILSQFLDVYYKLNKTEQINIDSIIDSHDDFTKESIRHILNKTNLIINDHNHLGQLIEAIPEKVVSNEKTLNKIKINKNFENFLNKISEEHKFDEIKNEIDNDKKNKLIDDVINKIKQDKKNNQFTSFLQEYLHESVINNDQLKQLYTLQKMKEMDLNRIKIFNSKRRGYIPNSYEQMQNYRFQSVNESKPLIDEGNNNIENKANTVQKALNETDKVQNSPDAETGDQDTKMTIGNTSKLNSTKVEKNVQEGANKGSSDNQAGQDIASAMTNAINYVNEKDEQFQKIDMKVPCDQKEEKLAKELDKKLAIMEQEMKEAKEDLKEVPDSILKIKGDPKGIQSMASDLISQFIAKFIELVVSHIPLIFFKICIPPGPLTFGCCPEAGFLPQQLYALFTAFSKVEKFKQVAKGYPDWLSSVGKEDISESEYYTCAQGYLTLQESSLFNICLPLSLIKMNPLNLLGIIPGDMPLCFWACIQTLVQCKVKLDDLAPCQAIISLDMAIKAIFDISMRLRMVFAFALCTYIPFLIRWDLVPKYKKPRKDPDAPSAAEQNNNNGNNDNNDDNNDKEPNCADKPEPPKQEPPSPFVEALTDLDPKNADNIINEINDQVQDSEPNPPEELEKYDRGAPVTKSSLKKTTINIESNHGVSLYDKRIELTNRNQCFNEKPTIMHEIQYHKMVSEDKEKDFPFNSKKIIINDI